MIKIKKTKTKKALIILGCMVAQLSYAQQVKETVYYDGKKQVQVFNFEQNTCSKNVIANDWKEYIKKQEGKLKGGTFSKVSGTELKFPSSAKLWSGSLIYEDKNSQEQSIYIYFSDEDPPLHPKEKKL